MLLRMQVAYNSARAAGDEAKCVDESGQSVLCCTWQVSVHLR